MDVIEKAKELGIALMEDERVKRYQTAKATNDADKELQDLIGEFNLKKLQLNNEFNKQPEDQSKEKIKEFDTQLREVYAKIMATAPMAEFTEAKKDVDELMEHINSILSLSVTGEAAGGSCAGDCSSCGGCH